MKTNKNINSMFALLLAAAVMVGGSIWFACSADDEFESNYEMETLAKGEMSLGAEPPAIIYNKHTSSMNTKVGLYFTGNDVDSCLISYRLNSDNTYDNFDITILSYTSVNPGYEVHGYIDDYSLIDGNYKFTLIFYATMNVNNNSFESNRVSCKITKQKNDFQ